METTKNFPEYKKAKEVMQTLSIKIIWATTDGQFFTSENVAKLHAEKNSIEYKRYKLKK